MSEVDDDNDDGERVRLRFVWFDGRLMLVDDLFRVSLTGVAAVFLISFNPLPEVNDAPLAPRPRVCPCPPRRPPLRAARPRAGCTHARALPARSQQRGAPWGAHC